MLVEARSQHIDYIETRLPFSVKAVPAKYCVISEAIFNITNDLLLDGTWKPENLNSSITQKLDPPMRLHNKVPFAPAHPLQNNIPLQEVFCDIY